MTNSAVEQLIRTKLTALLNEQKRRIAASLLELAPLPTVPKEKMPKNDTNKGDALLQRKQDKTAQIQALRAKISALQSKTATAKDPNALRQQLALQQDKLNTLQQQLTAIK